MHASLGSGDLTLLASDMEGAPGSGGLFARLAEGGTVTHPLVASFCGSTFGHRTDQHGAHWMVNREGTAGQ